MNRPIIYIGFDRREVDAFAVARHSIISRCTAPIPVRGLEMGEMVERGIYRRPTIRHDNLLWDEISEAPMATEFAITRFLVPHLAAKGWALFMDSDMLVRGNMARLFESLDPEYAVYCVKHHHAPEPGKKMDGQEQTRYARKNWSSFMVFNCDHPSNKKLTVDLVNTVPGRDLHRFCWLADEEIGELGQEWNWLVGHSSDDVDPAVVHFTDGIPSMAGYENQPYADEWRKALRDWIA